MKEKEPKFMQELHKVRERLSKRWQKMSSEELLKELNAYKLHKHPKQKAA
jgi:hypothetical protein